MTLTERMVEAAARAIAKACGYEWELLSNLGRAGYSDLARASLTAALALAEEAGALLVRVPTNADQWDSPGYDHGTPPNIIWADGHNAHRAATLAGRVRL